MTPDEYYGEMASAYDPIEFDTDDDAGAYQEHCSYCTQDDHTYQEDCPRYQEEHPGSICPTCKRLAQDAPDVTDGSHCTCDGICPAHADGQSDCYWLDWRGVCQVEQTP